MQEDPAAAGQAATKTPPPKFVQEEQHLRCPRCDSTNTKFCYYNNYNRSQPRHFCKGCRRYWTKGGALRNIPVGGGTRKNSKRAASASSSSSSSGSHPKRASSGTAAPVSPALATTSLDPGFPISEMEPVSEVYAAGDTDRQMMDFSGSFSSLLTASSGHFVSLLDSFHAVVPPVLGPPGAGDPGCPPVGSSALEPQNPSDAGKMSGSAAPPPPLPLQHAPMAADNLLGDAGCWNGGAGWPDLSIYTPGSTFQ